MNRRKKRMYISAAAMLLLVIVLIIILIYSVLRRTELLEMEPSPEPAEVTGMTPQPGQRQPEKSTPPLPTVSPSAFPGSTIPAITPPAITAVDPASGSDIILRPAKPSTNTDIDLPGYGNTGGNNEQ